MSKVLELRDKRAKAWEGAKAFLDSKRGENGLISAEDTATYEAMEADVVALGKEIERLERQTVIDAEMAKVTTQPIVGKPDSSGRNREKSGRATDEYKRSFWNVMRGGQLAQPHNALQIGTESKGGYLVPEEFERTLVEALEEENIIRQIAKVITSSHDQKIPIVATKGTANWVDENGAVPEGDDAFGQVTLSAFKVATTIKVSSELLQDSAFDIENYIAHGFARRIGNCEEEAFISGNGTGKPTGFLNATGGGQVGVTTAGAAAITLDELLDLYYSLKSPYRRKAVFVMNDATVKAIRKLKDSTGQYLWAPSIKEGIPDTILSRPIYTSAFMPELAAGNKTIAFGDFEYYWIADRQGRTFKRLDELYANNDQVGFLGTQRVDGKVIMPEAIKILQQKAT